MRSGDITGVAGVLELTWCYIVTTGYEGMDKETSWLPASEIPHASELISDFHHAYPGKPGPLSTS